MISRPVAGVRLKGAWQGKAHDAVAAPAFPDAIGIKSSASSMMCAY
jgi:hypothetical protein